MGEIVHTSRIKIVREKGPTRRAMIEGFNEPIYYGTHGGIKRFYKVRPGKEHAATLDLILRIKVYKGFVSAFQKNNPIGSNFILSFHFIKGLSSYRE